MILLFRDLKASCRGLSLIFLKVGCGLGTVYSAQCECGYQEDDLTDGCGMRMQSYVVVICRKCHRLSSKYLGYIGLADANAVSNKRCGHCRRGGIERYEVLETGKGECPQCGNHSLKFSVGIVWD